jgi:type I restriction enzyme S subunit
VSKLPNGWIESSLSAVADWGSGGTPKAAFQAYYGGDIPWAVIGDLNDGPIARTATSITESGLSNSSAKVVDRTAVLIAMYGSIGKLGLPTIPMATNQAIAFARPRTEILERGYLFYYLMRCRGELTTAGKGATQQNISQTILKAWPIPLPPLAEQERIVAAIEEQFSRLDAGVAALERAQRNLKRMRAAMLRDLLAGADSDRVEVESITTAIQYGYTAKASAAAVGPKMLRITDIQDGTVNWGTVPHCLISQDGANKFRLAPGDLVSDLLK